MAKLDHMPTKEIIDGFKGSIDFYLWRGIPVARKWPRKPRQPGTPEQKATWTRFKYINSLAGTLPPDVIAAYKFMAAGSGLTWKDYVIRLYLTGDGY